MSELVFTPMNIDLTFHGVSFSDIIEAFGKTQRAAECTDFSLWMKNIYFISSLFTVLDHVKACQRESQSV